MASRMVSEIKCHKRFGSNLALFLKDFDGVHCFWDNNSSNTDTLKIVHDTKLKKLINKILKEVKNTGFIPYHYILDFSNGDFIEDEKIVLNEARIMNIKVLESLSGKFALIHFLCDSNNYITKKYLTKTFNVELDSDLSYRVTARMKARIKSFNNKKVNLINYVRLKIVNE